jgi:hypothetical protein
MFTANIAAVAGHVSLYIIKEIFKLSILLRPLAFLTAAVRGYALNE